MNNLLTITETKLIKCFDRPSIRLKIKSQDKTPVDKNWPKVYEALTVSQLLQHGYNWGIRTGKKIGNYYFIIIDLDDIWAKERISAVRYVKTNKGIHVYCLIKELIPYLILINSNKKRIGEIHSLNRQVIGIGSIHPSGIRYSLHGKNNTPWFWKFENLLELENFLIKKGIFFKKSSPNFSKKISE